MSRGSATELTRRQKRTSNRIFYRVEQQQHDVTQSPVGVQLGGRWRFELNNDIADIFKRGRQGLHAATVERLPQELFGETERQNASKKFAVLRATI